MRRPRTRPARLWLWISLLFLLSASPVQAEPPPSEGGFTRVLLGAFDLILLRPVG